jgi:hypothetical protein
MIWLTINAAARNSTAYVRFRGSAPRSAGAVEIEQTVGPGAGACWSWPRGSSRSSSPSSPSC